ncbi:MAG: prefoldin subunit alpha [Nitrososphaeraceae archaeon]
MMEQRINEMAQQSRNLELYLNEIAGREATVARLLEEARLASNALQNINSNNETESLMPIGTGVFIKANIPQITKLLVNVGAGVTLEKTKEDTLNYIESRIKEFELALTQLTQQKQQITNQLEQIQHQINSMLRQASVAGTQSRSPQFNQSHNPSAQNASGTG